MARWFSSRFATDDRGRSVPLVSLYGWSVIRPRSSPFPESVLITMRANVERLAEKEGLKAWHLAVCVAMGGIPGVLGLVGIFTGFFVTPGHRMAWMHLSFLLFIPVFIFLFINFWTRRAYANWVIRAAVDEGHCPACGYAFANRAPQSDGCVVCSECGAAWKAEGGHDPQMVQP